MNKVVTLPQIEYQRLRKIEQRYEKLREFVIVDFFEEPPIKNISRIVKEFSQTKLYNQKFLKSLKNGLKESSYFSLANRR